MLYNFYYYYYKGHSVTIGNLFLNLCILLQEKSFSFPFFFLNFTSSIYVMLALFISMGAGYWEGHGEIQVGRSWGNPSGTFGAKCWEYWDPSGTFPVLMDKSWMSHDVRKKGDWAPAKNLDTTLELEMEAVLASTFLPFSLINFCWFGSRLLWWWTMGRNGGKDGPNLFKLH